MSRVDGDDDEGLGELPDEAQFEVSDGQEADDHDAQGHVVLPKAPGGVVHALLRQKLLPCATGNTARRFLSNQMTEPGHRPSDQPTEHNVTVGPATFI